MSGSLAGRVALVTGASSGIGEGTALALAAQGVAVAVSARRADRLTDLVSRIEQGGGKAVALPGDVADEAVATDAVHQTIERLGGLDILVNSAGVYQAGNVEDADIEEWRRVLDINLMATFYTCRAAIAPMKAQGRGDIVNITSTAGRRSGGGPYGVSKRAVTSLSQGLRSEVGGFGIRVCMIEPGATTTGVADGISNEAARDAMLKHVTKDGAMKVEDVAATIVFVLNLPQRVTVDEVLMRPTTDTSPM